MDTFGHSLWLAYYTSIVIVIFIIMRESLYKKIATHCYSAADLLFQYKAPKWPIPKFVWMMMTIIIVVVIVFAGKCITKRVSPRQQWEHLNAPADYQAIIRKAH